MNVRRQEAFAEMGWYVELNLIDRDDQVVELIKVADGRSLGISASRDLTGMKFCLSGR